MPIRAAVNAVGGLDSNHPGPPMPDRRFKQAPRLGVKNIGPSLVTSYGGPLSNSRQGPVGELSRRITDLKMEGHSPPKSSPISRGPARHLTDLQVRLAPPGPRRDSNSTTVSSYYGSMASSQFSRRSSQASQVRSCDSIISNLGVVPQARTILCCFYLCLKINCMLIHWPGVLDVIKGQLWPGLTVLKR